MMLRHFVLFLLAVLMAVAVRAQEGMRVVTLLSEDRGFVDPTPITTKDIVSHLASQYAGQARLPMVRIESCGKVVPPETFQAVMQGLQKNKFVVLVDLNPTAPRLCASPPQPPMLCEQPLVGSPAAMYDRIRQLPGAVVAQSRSPHFDVVNLPGQVWNFTKESHPAHPSVACRRIVQIDGQMRVETRLSCSAAKPQCDRLAEDYRALDKQILDAIKQQQPKQ
jgi:hypothetical protein